MYSYFHHVTYIVQCASTKILNIQHKNKRVEITRLTDHQRSSDPRLINTSLQYKISQKTAGTEFEAMIQTRLKLLGGGGIMNVVKCTTPRRKIFQRS